MNYIAIKSCLNNKKESNNLAARTEVQHNHSRGISSRKTEYNQSRKAAQSMEQHGMEGNLCTITGRMLKWQLHKVVSNAH